MYPYPQLRFGGSRRVLTDVTSKATEDTGRNVVSGLQGNTLTKVRGLPNKYNLSSAPGLGWWDVWEVVPGSSCLLKESQCLESHACSEPENQAFKESSPPLCAKEQTDGTSHTGSLQINTEKVKKLACGLQPLKVRDTKRVLVFLN